ncbi:MAG TPA: hypothetical protein VGK67_17080 [Myxococcales bacterium]|jgi:hypothetical protein
MRSAVFLLVLVASPAVLAQVPRAASASAPAYTRAGVDYWSAPVERPQARTIPHECERRFGKHTEVQALPAGGYRCTVPTPSEPRLSVRLREELDLVADLPEPRRQKMIDSLTEKYSRLAQCPAGTEAQHDGTLFFCHRDFTARELCPSGSPTALDSGEIGCVATSCAKGATDLGALTRGEHPGCFVCPRGRFDARETAAFHGALKGLPADYQEVFCREGEPASAPKSSPEAPAPAPPEKDKK